MSLTEEMIFPVDINQEVKQSFLDYSVSVITDRALPDVRDGLKPVHRRILYAMHELKLTNNKPHTKSARAVGEVLGSYHPHGDKSVYDAMVRLAQPFSLNYPLVDGHGNYGNIDGDAAAHYRYTETKLSKVGEEMLVDINKETVEWKKNFSENKLEPVVLPARLPQLLMNGVTGIAVGMACSFAPHNLGDIVNAIEQFVEDEDISDSELLDIVGGPDFPTGGLVINKDELLSGYKTGRGRIRIRGKYKIEKRGSKELIVFYEIPYMTRKSKIVEDIAKLAEEKEVEGITDVRDESAREMALVVEVKRGYNPDRIADILFARTQLENTYSINNTCLVNGNPQTLSFKKLINHYVTFQKEIITKRTRFDLNKVLTRIEIVEGLIIALADIDKVIAIIKKSDSTKNANNKLQEKFLLSENQARSVLAMRLSSLTRLEIEELKKERKTLEQSRINLEKILNSEELLNTLFITELKDYAEPYIVDRRTKIDNIIVEKSEKEELTKKIEKVNISINDESIVSFVAKKQFKNKANRESSVYQIATDTSQSLTIFMSSGVIFKIPVDGLRAGDSLYNILETKPNDRIVNILTDDEKEFIVFLTKQGMFKKTCLSEYQNIRRTGVIGIKLRENDEVVAIDFIDEEPVIVMSSDGRTIKFSTKDIKAIGRNSMGVIAIKLNEGTFAVDFSVDSEEKDYFITTTKNGFVKKTAKNEYPIQGRNGKGVIGVKLQEGDEAFFIQEASNDDRIIFYGTGRLVKTSVKDISVFGRSSMGNGLVKEGKVTNVHLI